MKATAVLEITSTRMNPLVDPQLHAWGWEIPVYLFFGGMIAGMMILAGRAMWRLARGDDPASYFSVQTPLLGFVLMNVGMGALFLDLTHKLHVWAVYLTLQPSAPMSWGSWVLLVVYGVLMLSALVRIQDSWPWLARKLPVLVRLSDGIAASPARLRALAGANVVLGIALGIYTGILLSAMAARPLWNSAVLGPLFLFSGLSAAAATVHLATRALPGRPAPEGALGGAFAALWQPLGATLPATGTERSLVRADVAFLAVELALIALLVADLATSTPAHREALGLLFAWPYAPIFWGGIVVLGIVVPMALQALELGHRIRHTALPAILVLAGGFALRWVLVNAGQASHFTASTGM
jgi:formate-dependent nitrite reductase membrane component NrfD